MSAHCEEQIDFSEAGDDVIIGFIIMNASPCRVRSGCAVSDTHHRGSQNKLRGTRIHVGAREGEREREREREEHSGGRRSREKSVQLEKGKRGSRFPPPTPPRHLAVAPPGQDARGQEEKSVFSKPEPKQSGGGGGGGEEGGGEGGGGGERRTTIFTHSRLDPVETTRVRVPIQRGAALDPHGAMKTHPIHCPGTCMEEAVPAARPAHLPVNVCVFPRTGLLPTGPQQPAVPQRHGAVSPPRHELHPREEKRPNTESRPSSVRTPGTRWKKKPQRTTHG
ncbi:unnamed protein product [Pleuronectes platessa]|uniref:Uncharacterized protein n=1 Tax=Pleuronectes platessa TaxID=8262 RepID=A0A9N7YZS7_PLEPL|nr:unnamed protein product [Pleuronectes platessa]